MMKATLLALVLLMAPVSPRTCNAEGDMQKTIVDQALENARLANEAFARSRRFIDGWLKHADPKTGLIPRNLKLDRNIWNAKDSAADNYPFMVLTAAMTDRPLFKGRMLEMLRTETRLTCRIGRMPDTWSFTKQNFHSPNPDVERIIFGSSEYMKDGLLAITEWLGHCPWTERMLGILDDLWKHAPVETRFGSIASLNTEVNGEMLQVLCRMYWMTGKKQYLDYACRIGDYYLLGENHPTRNMDRLRLIAHGGEIVSGLCELYVTVSFAAPKKKENYEKPLHEMLDRILAVGRNEHGMIYVTIHPKTGAHDDEIADTWGYTYNGYWSVYMIDRTDSYRQAVLKVMGNLREHYTDYTWERGSSDGFADSIESALNLYNREPVASAREWIDHEIRYMFKKQRADGVIEGWHGDGNSARTWLLYALWKTSGLTIRPWRPDVRYGAVRKDGKLHIVLAADKRWTGRILFDQPRHKVNLRLPIDYPRLNQFPEWFVAEVGKQYVIHNSTAGTRKTVSGRQLVEGLKVKLEPGAKLQLLVIP